MTSDYILWGYYGMYSASATAEKAIELQYWLISVQTFLSIPTVGIARLEFNLLPDLVPWYMTLHMFSHTFMWFAYRDVLQKESFVVAQWYGGRVQIQTRAFVCQIEFQM